MAQLVGKRFGNYQVVELLGEGGMATVYRAQQLTIKRDIALKVVKPELSSSDEFLQRFEREAQTVAGLSHPHILKIFDYGQYRGSPYLAMELLTGGSLSSLLHREAPTLETVGHILGQICQALSYAHNLGIVHRDLKPHNVMMDSHGNAILTDFGLAKLATGEEQAALTQTGAPLGTPAYMSPEQWRGEKVDARSDIYALGVMLFEMLTGEPLYHSETPYDLMHKHLFVVPPSLRDLREDLPATLEPVLMRALAKNRDDRYLTATLLFDDFKQAVASQVALTTTMPSIDLTDSDPVSLVSPSQAAAQEQEALARIQAERMGNSRSGMRADRLVGALPQDVSERFVGRGKAVTDVGNLLMEHTRLVSIYGRGGVGKTALACKVLTDLLAVGTVDAVVSLSAVNGTARLDRILNDFGKLLSGEDRSLISGIARDGDLPAAQKAAVLLEKLRDGRFILFIDGLEALLDPTSGELTDPGVKAFVETALGQGGGLGILITSREPLTLPRNLKTWERLIPLEQGLQAEEGIALLRAFDADGAAGLRDASEAQLQEMTAKTGSLPRALEAIAGLLLEDPLLSIDDVLRDLSHLEGEVTQILVQQAIERLGPDALRVMQGLALFRMPVNQTALEFLLAPYMDTAGLRNILARLVRTYFVTFNKANGQFALHPMDRETCYQAIPTSESDSFNRNVLHRRAAEYYQHQRKAQKDWRSLDDLSPQLAEFDHLVSAGDYDAATNVLMMIDRDYLWDWGQRPLLNKMHSRLKGHIHDWKLAHWNRRRLAWMEFFYNLETSEPLFKALLEDARQKGDRRLEADALDDLAQCRRGHIDMAGGMELHRQALMIYREIGDRQGEADALGGMGAAAAYFAPDEAIPYLDEAFALQTELNNRHSMAFLLNVQGIANNAMGNFEQTIRYYQQSVELARELNSTQVLVYSLVGLGEAYSFLGDYPTALDYLNQSEEVARLSSGGGISNGLVYTLAFQAQALSASGDIARAVESLRQLVAQVKDIQVAAMPAALSVYVLLLLLVGEDQQALEYAKGLYKLPLPPFLKIMSGLAMLRNGKTDEATQVFSDVLVLLEPRSPILTVLDLRGFALAAQAVLTGDAAKVQAAAENYQQARTISRAPGYLTQQLTLLEYLMQCPGGEMLEPARVTLLT